MPENGAKTVEAWQPKHEGCSVIGRVQRTVGFNVFIDVLVSWTRPPVKDLDRVKTFKVSARITTNDDRTLAALDHYCEEQIEKIVHEDSIRLLAQGKRTQTADTDRFIAEQKGEACLV